ncbi:hypothetical protein [Corynebacterium halotolerans]|uniref:Uncharacterized protein n=1 Tax=Corynebacterium halotolerans YIM 70093 = DSM 44683 TaxID=1121362 RepID=M1NQ80_9CORY|nr:hypothetical protein [Corynebacterium halotolerans]AGF71662.1 hypothetical protein A605_03245 [Corynebacterium halotolerans YIM 70093 = DSM 44683]
MTGNRRPDRNAPVVFLFGVALSLWLGLRHSWWPTGLLMLALAVAGAIVVHLVRSRHRDRG